MKKIVPQRGIVTLAILLLLNSLLIVLLIVDDERLASYSLIDWQYQSAIKQNVQLQQQVIGEAERKCKLLTLNQLEDMVQITFKSKVKLSPLIQTIWCERKKLFKRQPTKSHYSNQLFSYINLDVLQYFQSKLSKPKASIQDKKSAKLYFFSKEQEQWVIDGDHYAVVLAEGNLSIRGEGKLYGSVLTAGNLHTEDTVELVYKKNIIIALMNKYRFWQKAERSWYDLK